MFIVQCNGHIFIRPGLHRQKPAIVAFQPPRVNRGDARSQPSGWCKQWTASYVHFIENKPLQNHYRSHAIALLKLCPFKTRNGKFFHCGGKPSPEAGLGNHKLTPSFQSAWKSSILRLLLLKPSAKIVLDTGNFSRQSLARAGNWLQGSHSSRRQSKPAQRD